MFALFRGFGFLLAFVILMSLGSFLSHFHSLRLCLYFCPCHGFRLHSYFSPFYSFRLLTYSTGFSHFKIFNTVSHPTTQFNCFGLFTLFRPIVNVFRLFSGFSLFNMLNPFKWFIAETSSSALYWWHDAVFSILSSYLFYYLWRNAGSHYKGRKTGYFVYLIIEFRFSRIKINTSFYLRII